MKIRKGTENKSTCPTELTRRRPGWEPADDEIAEARLYADDEGPGNDVTTLTLPGKSKRQLCMWRMLRILHPALPLLPFNGKAISEKDGGCTYCYQLLTMHVIVRLPARSASLSRRRPSRVRFPRIQVTTRYVSHLLAFSTSSHSMRVVLTDCATTLRLVLSGDTGPLRGVPMNLNKI